MTGGSKLDNRTALRIAWREARASGTKFFAVILAVAIGVAALTGVRGFSRAFHKMLLREARTLMAADLMVRVFALPTDRQKAVLDRLQAEGVDRTWISETLTMASVGIEGNPILVSVKAVDPSKYPFYGSVQLEPAGSLRARLTPDAVAVSRDLLLRLNAKVGDRVRIGGLDFRIIGLVASEPDRMTGSLNVGPRILMSRAALDRTGLLIAGSRASERFLFRVPPRIPIARVHDELKKVFEEGLITDYRQSHPAIEQGLERATVFLSLVSLIALIVAAIGVSMAIDSHLRQKLDSIAVMKCIGARSSQIIRIYTTQTLALGAIGGVLGIAAGLAVQAAFPLLLARYFHSAPPLLLDPLSAAQGFAIGTLSTLLFTLPPLLSIRRIRPGLVLRRDVAVERRGWRQRVKDQTASAASVLAILAGIAGIAAWLSDSPKTGVIFVMGLGAAILVMVGVGWLLLRSLRWFGREVAWRLRPSLRHGIANLYRPGAHTHTTIVALGIGVMFTLTVYLVQSALLADMRRTTPPGMPNVFLLDMTPANRAAVMDLIAHQKGLEGKPESIGTVSARLISIDGKPLVREKLKGIERRYASTVPVTEAAAKPNYTRVLSGRWWSADRPPSQAQVSVSEDAARVMHLSPGARLEWSTPVRNFSATVAAIHRTEAIRLSARVEFYFSPGTLAGLPVIYYGTVRVKPQLVPELQKAVYNQFPTVTIVNVADVMQIVQDVVDQIAVVIRFISGFSIFAGVVILASSVAGTRLRRIREVVILKTLGGTKRRIREIFSLEFSILGATAGLAGTALAIGFSAIVLHRLLKAEVQIDPVPAVLAIVATAAVANAAGWIASMRILGQRPLEILRQEQ